MKVLITGGRDYDHWAKVHAFLDALEARYGIIEVAQGGAKGADLHAWTWCQLRGIGCKTYPADWSGGRSAGIDRNVKMHDDFKPNLVVAFEGGRGTAHMTGYASDCGTPTLVVPDPEWRARQVDHDDVLVVQFDEEGEEVVRAPDKPFWVRPPTAADKLIPRGVPTPAERYMDAALF